MGRMRPVGQLQSRIKVQSVKSARNAVLNLNGRKSLRRKPAGALFRGGRYLRTPLFSTTAHCRLGPAGGFPPTRRAFFLGLARDNVRQGGHLGRIGHVGAHRAFRLVREHDRIASVHVDDFDRQHGRHLLRRDIQRLGIRPAGLAIDGAGEFERYPKCGPCGSIKIPPWSCPAGQTPAARRRCR